MKPIDFDTLLNRYLNGELGPAEERAFLGSIEGNAKLQQIVSAESIMRSALRRDRASIPADHGATRAAMLGKLGALSAGAAGAAGATSMASSAAHGSAAASGISAATAPVTGSAVAGSSILAGIGAKLAVLGVVTAITVGTYVGFRNNAHETPAGMAPAPAAAPVVTAPPAPSVQAVAPEAVVTDDTTHRTAPAKRTHGTSAAAPVERKEETPSTATASGASPTTTSSQPSVEPAEKKPEVVNDPKAKMHVEVERPKP